MMADCKICKSKINKEDSIIVCDDCGCDFHIACVGVTKAVFKSISEK